jgi:hypothetical protein
VAQALRSEAGGIGAALAILREHGGAIEADLLRSGLSMRMVFTGQLSIRELMILLKYPEPGSAFARKVLGEDHHWNLGNQLLAAIADRIGQGNWQRGGGKGQRPRPIKRPGVTSGTTTRVGNTKGLTPAQVQSELEMMSGRKLGPVPVMRRK